MVIDGQREKIIELPSNSLSDQHLQTKMTIQYIYRNWNYTNKPSTNPTRTNKSFPLSSIVLIRVLHRCEKAQIDNIEELSHLCNSLRMVYLTQEIYSTEHLEFFGLPWDVYGCFGKNESEQEKKNDHPWIFFIRLHMSECHAIKWLGHTPEVSIRWSKVTGTVFENILKGFFALSCPKCIYPIVFPLVHAIKIQYITVSTLSYIVIDCHLSYIYIHILIFIYCHNLSYLVYPNISESFSLGGKLPTGKPSLEQENSPAPV